MRAVRKTIIATLVLLCAIASNGFAAEHKYSLIVVEFGKDSAGEQTQTIVRYRFHSGVLSSRETILTARTNDLRFDLGANRIADNRYVIPRFGEGVDLTTGKRFDKSQVKVAALQNLQTETTSHWGQIEIPSPSGKLLARGDNFKIWLDTPERKDLLLGDEFSRSGTAYCNSVASPTFVWIDESHLLTQRGDGNIVLVNIGGNVQPVVTIPNVVPLACGPELRLDKGGNVFYETKEKAWLIHLAERTFEPYIWESEGNGFEMEHARNDSDGRVIRYQGTEIGRWWSDSVATAPGQIAIEFGPVGSNLGYPEGVKVWSAENRHWTTIKLGWIAALIGWVED